MHSNHTPLRSRLRKIKERCANDSPSTPQEIKPKNVCIFHSEKSFPQDVPTFNVLAPCHSPMFTPRASSPRGMLSSCPPEHSQARSEPFNCKMIPRMCVTPPPPKCPLRGRARFFEPTFTLPPQPTSSSKPQMPRLCACAFARANAHAP